MSYKLGSYSHWNHARDFWHFTKTEVVTWIRAGWFGWFQSLT